MSETLLKLVEEQNSLDNSLRNAAEAEFSRLAVENPSSVAFFLMELASNNELTVDLRQSCLIHLKQLVPKYWSMGFQSFIGPPIDQALKAAIRTNLLQLLVSPYAKVRNAVAYAIVQIAAADYPDEWPDLLNVLYQMSTTDNDLSIIGSLTVFTDLFDDLITEDQFWEGQVGNNISNHILVLLKTNILFEAKIIAIKLYQSIVQNLQSPEAFATEERKLFVLNHIQQSFTEFIELLKFDPTDVSQFAYKSYIFKVLYTFVGAFNKKIDTNLKTELMDVALVNFNSVAQTYKSNVIDGNQTLASSQEFETDAVLIDLISDILQTINVTSHSIRLNSSNIDTLYNCLLTSALLPQETIESYYSDINELITNITGLSVEATVRDSILELMSEINEDNAKDLFLVVLNFLQGSHPDTVNEANLFILECILQNEVTIETNAVELLRLVTSFIKFDGNALVLSRCFLLLPHFFEKFEDTLSVKSFGTKSFTDMIDFATQYNGDHSEIVKFTALVSITLYNNFLNLEESIDQSKKHQVQDSIFKLVYVLTAESEEDGLAALLEATTVAIDIDPINASKSIIDNGVNVIDLIFKISFKDASNLQLTIGSSESLQTLLEKISIDDYLVCCEKSLPFIFNVVNNAIEVGGTNVEYTPDLYLSLELLSIIINSVPQGEIPESIFGYTFPILKKLLLLTTDNQILQSGGEVFNNMLKRASKLFVNYVGPDEILGIDSLLEIVSKFLSPELSDSAAMNTGLIVISLINQFQPYLGDSFLTQILDATVRRLVLAKETITIENLIMVFCNLVLSSPSQMIDFLGNSITVTYENREVSGLEAILSIWFESFEVTRGYEKIKQNSLALGKIFMLGDLRVENLMVKGDIIPYDGDKIITRSMAKSMPDQYTQVSASLKILKLLVGELDFQNQQPNAADYLPIEDEANDDADGEGWEDLEDIGVPNFEKLKSYVDSDNEEEVGSDESLNQILQAFFKECTAKNLGNFQKYYEMLSDNEKKVITECIAF